MKRILSLLIILVAFNATLLSQINTNRVMMMGRNALYYEDYVLAIQRLLQFCYYSQTLSV